MSLTYIPEMSTSNNLWFTDTATGNVVNMTPDAANALPDTSFTNVPPTSQTAAGASSGMENLAQAQIGMSIGSTVAGICSSIIGYVTAKNQMDFQRKSTLSQLEHQDAMAEKQMEMEMDKSYWQEKGISDKVEFQAEYFKANESRVKQEKQLSIAKARVAEKLKTEKAGRINTKSLDRLFRTNYAYGKPAAA